MKTIQAWLSSQKVFIVLIILCIFFLVVDIVMVVKNEKLQEKIEFAVEFVGE